MKSFSFSYNDTVLMSSPAFDLRCVQTVEEEVGFRLRPSTTSNDSHRPVLSLTLEPSLQLILVAPNAETSRIRHSKKLCWLCTTPSSQLTLQTWLHCSVNLCLSMSWKAVSMIWRVLTRISQRNIGQISKYPPIMVSAVGLYAQLPWKLQRDPKVLRTTR